MSTFIHRSYEAQIDRFGIEQGDMIWFADSLAEARGVGSSSMEGIPLIHRRLVRNKDKQSYLVTLSYEGQSTEGGAPPDPEVNETVEGEAMFVREPIETCPSLDTLLSKFSGSIDAATGKVRWARQLRSSSSSGTGLSSTTARTTNPMYGRTDYAVAGAEVIHTFVRAKITGDLFEDLNQIITDLPSSIPSNGRPDTPKGRNWMVMAPRWVSRGNVSQIFRRYRLSPPGGFTSDLYALFVK